MYYKMLLTYTKSLKVLNNLIISKIKCSKQQKNYESVTH